MIYSFFDTHAFLKDVKTIRRQRMLTINQVFHQTGISPVSLTRFEQVGASRIDVQTMVILSAWAELDINAYVKHAKEKADAERANVTRASSV